MSRLIDLTGKRFGKLTVVSREKGSIHGSPRWLCVCDCGNTCIVNGRDLRAEHTRSCGCLRRETAHSIASHRMSDTRLYRIWCDMKNRCYNENVNNYHSYGGRGIKVCNEWLDPSSFFSWAKDSGYTDELTLDRIDVNGDYEPNNCKWITLTEQQWNKTTSFFIEIDGETKCLREWCNEFGSEYKTVHHRIKYLGWEPKRALTTPVDKSKRKKKVGENHG